MFIPLQEVRAGDMGFTYYPGSWLSRWIAWFSRALWWREEKLPVSHTFPVISRLAGVEAHIEHGVRRFYLMKYARDQNCRLYFKRLRDWTPGLGRRIAQAAECRIGHKYDRGLILAQFLDRTFLGRWLNRLTRGWMGRHVARVLNRHNQEICSELVAETLKAQPEFRHVRLLHRAASLISPQQLFDDEELWEI